MPHYNWGRKTSAVVEEKEVVLLIGTLTLRPVSHYTLCSGQLSLDAFFAQLDLKLLKLPDSLGIGYMSVSRPPSCLLMVAQALFGKCKSYSKKDGVRKQLLLGAFLSLDLGPQRTDIVSTYYLLSDLLFLFLFFSS
jgi:hypothetical protein